MRSDYALYTVSVICFVLAAIVFAIVAGGYHFMEPQISLVTTVVLAVLGLISAGAGYLVRPEEIIPPPIPRPAAPKPSAPPTPLPKRTVTPPVEITEVRGIGPKRAERLRALGINTAQDLAETTATTLAAKTGLSTKITQKWVREAKRFTEEGP
jgi:hypothetical protein